MLCESVGLQAGMDKVLIILDSRMYAVHVSLSGMSTMPILIALAVCTPGSTFRICFKAICKQSASVLSTRSAVGRPVSALGSGHDA